MKGNGFFAVSNSFSRRRKNATHRGFCYVDHATNHVLREVMSVEIDDYRSKSGEPLGKPSLSGAGSTDKIVEPLDSSFVGGSDCNLVARRQRFPYLSRSHSLPGFQAPRLPRIGYPDLFQNFRRYRISPIPSRCSIRQFCTEASIFVDMASLGLPPGNLITTLDFFYRWTYSQCLELIYPIDLMGWLDPTSVHMTSETLGKRLLGSANITNFPGSRIAQGVDKDCHGGL